MHWFLLLIAALFEIAWAIGLKHTAGWTRLGPSLLTVAAMLISVWLLSLAVRGLPLGTAYAVWTGIGAAGTALIGMLLLGEVVSVARIASTLAIVIGVLGLKLSST